MLKSIAEIRVNSFICSKDVGFPVEAEQQLGNKYEYLNRLFVNVVPSYSSRCPEVTELSVKEFDMCCRHNMESAVDLAYKLLAGCSLGSDQLIQGFQNDVAVVLTCLRYLHGKRIPPEYVPGFLLLIVKYHYFS